MGDQVSRDVGGGDCAAGIREFLFPACEAHLSWFEESPPATELGRLGGDGAVVAEAEGSTHRTRRGGTSRSSTMLTISARTSRFAPASTASPSVWRLLLMAWCSVPSADAMAPQFSERLDCSGFVHCGSPATKC